MTLEEAIQTRYSCRSYLNKKIEGPVLEELQEAVEECNRTPGIQIQLVLDRDGVFDGFKKSYGLFKGVRNYFLLSGKDDGACKEKAGYFGEALVLRATQLGLGTCWVGATFDKENCGCELRPGEILYCAIAVGYPSDSPTMADRLISIFNKRKTKPLEEMCTAEGEMPQWYQTAIEAVQKAPSALNKQPVHFHLQGNRVSVRVTKGPFAQVDQGIAKCHFEIGAGSANWHYAQ